MAITQHLKKIFIVSGGFKRFEQHVTAKHVFYGWFLICINGKLSSSRSVIKSSGKSYLK